VNTVERSLAVAGSEEVLVPRHLPDYIRIKITQKAITRRQEGGSAREEETPRSSTMPSLQEVRNNAVAKAEREYLQDLFVLTGNNISQALKISGLAKSRFYELMKKYRLGPQKDILDAN